MIAPKPALRVPIFVLATFLLFLLYRCDFIENPFDSRMSSDKRLKVSILETKGRHDEVSASFFSALGQMPECEVDGFLAATRFNIGDIYAQLPGIRKRIVNEISRFTPAVYEESTNPDIVISITGAYDMVAKEVAPTLNHLFEKTNCILFAVVHHPDEWKGAAHFNATRPWIKAKRIRFITLSNHVSNYMTTTIVKSWEKHIDTNSLHVNTFPPVFVIPSLSRLEANLAVSSPIHFAMQGDLVVDRNPNRDYTGTFKRFAKLLANKTRPLELHVLGNGGIPPVPAAAKDSIIFDVSFPYPEFYAGLHSATALLPAFASKDYLISKASSTIPASFVAGSPLIAGQELLDAYTFVDKEDVYFREKGEDEIDVVARIARLPEEERARKAKNLREKNELLTKETSELMRGWIKQAQIERDM